MFTTGQLVFDKRARSVCRIGTVEYVPITWDLFGDPMPAHLRYTVAYEDRGIITGEWNNDRRESDLAPIIEAAPERSPAKDLEPTPLLRARHPVRRRPAAAAVA